MALSTRAAEPGRPRLRAPGAAVPLAVLPAVLVAVLSFHAGGFFPASTALAALVLAAALILRITVAERPLSVSLPLVVGAAALGGLALWTLLSAGWSDAPGRALVEYDRALLYLLALIVGALAGRTVMAARWQVRALALAAVAVSAAALATRLFPDVFEISANVAAGRLSFPITYWNALGLLAAVGIVLCLALSSDLAERSAVRVAAAAAVPLLATTLLLTFSRAAIGACAVGLLVVIVLGRSRGLPAALLAAAPASAVAVLAGYDADLLAGARPATDAAAEQGHDVAFVVALCVVGAAVARAVLVMLDRRLAAPPVPEWARRRSVRFGTLGAVVVAAVALALALGAGGNVERQYERFVEGDEVRHSQDLRGRLTEAGNNGRVEQWEVALRGFEDDALRGSGAGTYALLWDRHRESVFQVEDAHSLWLETLGELGLVGTLLLAAALLLVVGALLLRARGPHRLPWAALAAAAVVWLVQAAVDWQWEMPAVTLWLFAAGGLALAAPAGTGPRVPGLARVALALGVLLVAVTPWRLATGDAALRDAQRAFAAGDCRTAVDRALDAAGATPSRAQPYQILAVCDVGLGRPDLAVRAAEKAVARDPGNWEMHYVAALARGAAGRDPRGAAKRALRLNPREALAQEAVEQFSTSDPQKWRRRALGARLPSG